MRTGAVAHGGTTATSGPTKSKGDEAQGRDDARPSRAAARLHAAALSMYAVPDDVPRSPAPSVASASTRRPSRTRRALLLVDERRRPRHGDEGGERVEQIGEEDPRIAGQSAGLERAQDVELERQREVGRADERRRPGREAEREGGGRDGADRGEER